MVEWKKLGDICEIKGRIGFRGYTREDQVEKGEGAISLSPGNIIEGSMNYDSCTYITWRKYEESPEIMVNEGDIILCKTASVGKVARIHQLPEKATINPQLVLIKNIKSNPQYLFYVLDDNPFQAKIKGLAGIGSVPNVSQAKLASIEIPIPSLSEQTRIVGILDTFTSSIENLKQQIAQRRKQYEFYRDQLLDLKGKEGVEMKTLGEICIKTSNIRWKTISDNEIFKYIDLSSVNRDTHTIDDVLEINKDNAPSRAQQIVNRGDIILGTTRPTLRRYCQIPKQYDNQICSTGFCIYRPNTDVVFNRWLFHNIGNWRFWDYCELKQQGAGYPCLSNSDAFAYVIPVPPLSEQQRIVSILDTFETSVRNLEQQLTQREKQYEYYRNKLLTFD